MKLCDNEVRVRFAPSPTGYLHIGGARTAIFNWLFAKHHNGKFLLRIEDTDLSRSSEEMVQAIFNGLQWLSLRWDEEPVYQSERIDYYKQICDKLISSNKAYFCYCSHERLAQLKEQAAKQKSDYQYDRYCRNLTVQEKQKLEDKKIPKVIRFKVEKGETKFTDAVHGSLTFDNEEIDDFVILKSDGMPTYHLAVVADDNKMNITNVIRGDDHISNTPKQVLLYDALGWKPPLFAHVPLILGPDKKRLSKRHGATSISEYINIGYTSEAMLNFLALLGWSPGDNREIMTSEELIEAFSFSGISKKSAVFEEKKLLWMNDQYISNYSDEKLAEKVIPILEKKGLIDSERVEKGDIKTVVRLLKPKIKLLSDFAELGSYFFADPFNYDEKARNKYWNNIDVVSRLKALNKKLVNLDKFNAEKIEKELRGLAEELNISAAKLIHPTRLALTGFGVSPGLFELIEVLGKETVLRRIQKAINVLE